MWFHGLSACVQHDSVRQLHDMCNNVNYDSCCIKHNMDAPASCTTQAAVLLLLVLLCSRMPRTGMCTLLAVRHVLKQNQAEQWRLCNCCALLDCYLAQQQHSAARRSCMHSQVTSRVVALTCTPCPPCLPCPFEAASRCLRGLRAGKNGVGNNLSLKSNMLDRSEGMRRCCLFV
jgi:hypothetical protein